MNTIAYLVLQLKWVTRFPKKFYVFSRELQRSHIYYYGREILEVTCT